MWEVTIKRQFGGTGEYSTPSLSRMLQYKKDFVCLHGTISGDPGLCPENKIENGLGKFFFKYFKTQNGIQFLKSQKDRLHKYKVRSGFGCLESQ